MTHTKRMLAARLKAKKKWKIAKNGEVVSVNESQAFDIGFNMGYRQGRQSKDEEIAELQTQIKKLESDYRDLEEMNFELSQGDDL